MTMTKKDFEAIAGSLARAKAYHFDLQTINYIKASLAKYFGEEYPRFDIEKFNKAMDGE